MSLYRLLRWLIVALLAAAVVYVLASRLGVSPGADQAAAGGHSDEIAAMP